MDHGMMPAVCVSPMRTTGITHEIPLPSNCSIGVKGGCSSTASVGALWCLVFACQWPAYLAMSGSGNPASSSSGGAAWTTFLACRKKEEKSVCREAFDGRPWIGQRRPSPLNEGSCSWPAVDHAVNAHRSHHSHCQWRCQLPLVRVNSC